MNNLSDHDIILMQDNALIHQAQVMLEEMGLEIVKTP